MAKTLQHPINHDFKQTPKDGLPQFRQTVGSSKPTTKPQRGSSKGAMIQGPFGGKKPA